MLPLLLTNAAVNRTVLLLLLKQSQARIRDTLHNPPNNTRPLQGQETDKTGQTAVRQGSGTYKAGMERLADKRNTPRHHPHRMHM